MIRSEICAALSEPLRVHAETAMGDALADLLARAWPNDWPVPPSPFHDSVDYLEAFFPGVLAAWDLLAKSNGPSGSYYREAARAVRAALELAREKAR